MAAADGNGTDLDEAKQRRRYVTRRRVAEIARVLGMPLDHASPSSIDTARSVSDDAKAAEGLALLRAFNDVVHADTRKGMVHLLQAVASVERERAGSRSAARPGATPVGTVTRAAPSRGERARKATRRP